MSSYRSDVIGFGLRQMRESEVDAEMARYFQEEESRIVQEKLNADIFRLEKGSTVVADVVKPSLEMEEAMRRIKAARHPVLRVVAPKKIPVEGDALSGVPVSPPAGSMIATTVLEPAEDVGPTGTGKLIRSVMPVKLRCAASFDEFPTASDPETECSGDSVGEMTELCNQLRRHRDYARVRDDYCRLSIRLNAMGRLAPAYRPELNAGAPWGNDIYKVIHRDQIVIDLHWCHQTQMQLRPLEGAHRSLLVDTPIFQFDRAFELAIKKWRSGYRADEALCMTRFQQCQLLKLHGGEVTDILEGIRSGWRDSAGKKTSKAATVRCMVSAWAERDARIATQRDYYEKLWLARELLGHDESKQKLAELHALMMGAQVQNRTTIRDRLNRLDKHVKID